MKAKDNPTAFRRLRLSESEKYRSILCPNYGDCLEVAIKHKWRGFHCLNCSKFEGGITIMTEGEIIEEIMDFLKEFELPEPNTVYDRNSCGKLVNKSIKKLFVTINNLKDEKSKTVKKNVSDDNSKKVYKLFLETWNKQDIIQHKKITTKRRAAIDKALRANDYTVVEILKAFENYGKILKSKDSYWDYQWTMEDFLNRGLHKFVDEAQPLKNMTQKDSKFGDKKKSNENVFNFACC